MTSQKSVALVTGANKGIGFEICRQLGKLGFTVILSARNSELGKVAADQLSGEGIDARFVKLDMEDAAGFEPVRKYIEDEFGKLDVLVNNAGFAIDWEYKADTVPMDLIRKTYEGNFFGLIDLTQRLLPLILRSEQGRIVNQSSGLGSLTLHSLPDSPLGDTKPFAYNSSKTALNAFTVHLADALRHTPVKVNSTHPGEVKTDANPNATMTIEDGAKTAVQMATLPADGPTGGFFHLGNTLPW
jgi:NAD(P)-dependent dehydrogenase (short-subunit alcohol dehydrogenase family)